MSEVQALPLPGTWLRTLKGFYDPAYEEMFRYYRELPFPENEVFHGIFFAENPNDPLRVLCTQGCVRVLLWLPNPESGIICNTQTTILKANTKHPQVVIAEPDIAVGLLSISPNSEAYISNASAPTGSNVPGLYEELLHYTDPQYVTFNPTGIWG